MHGNDLTVCWLRFRWWTQRENDHFEWFLLNSRAAGVLSKGVGWLSRTSVARKSWDGFVKYVVNGQHILSSRVSPSQRWWQLGLWEGLGRSSFIPKTHLSEMLGITLRSSDSQPVRFAHPSFSLSWVSLILFANLSGSGSTFPLRQKSPPGFHSSSFFIRMASRSFVRNKANSKIMSLGTNAFLKSVGCINIYYFADENFCVSSLSSPHSYVSDLDSNASSLGHQLSEAYLSLFKPWFSHLKMGVFIACLRALLWGQRDRKCNWWPMNSSCILSTPAAGGFVCSVWGHVRLVQWLKTQ